MELGWQRHFVSTGSPFIGFGCLREPIVGSPRLAPVMPALSWKTEVSQIPRYLRYFYLFG
jgi:formate hydrogenlyase subunit 4